ncbi:GH10044 [Drosophila grimshawi]|uniref:GH10044 n=1 Tax=Drosophila grimshawi TaxID=7222 RepID=B4K0Z9_DROGR|nr:GH10044 [Drosophila grimshawi]
MLWSDKDIRAQIHAANDSYSSHGASHHLISCDASRLLQQLPASGSNNAATAAAAAAGGNEAGFYQIESPPCYTIATGLPSYDEALHHQPRHFACGMKFVYPSLAAVHHHHHHHSNQRACITNWEKDAVQQQQQQQRQRQQQRSNKLQKCKLSATEEQTRAQLQLEDKALPAICINMPAEQEMQNERQPRNVASTVATTDATQTLLPAAAADDDCASLVVVVAA